jgi:hypothetical protein
VYQPGLKDRNGLVGQVVPPLPVCGVAVRGREEERAEREGGREKV